MAIKKKVTAEKIVKKIPIDEIMEALTNEYRRRLIRYKMVDESMEALRKNQSSFYLDCP